VSPELHLVVANKLNGLLHLIVKSFKLFNISQLLIDVLVLMLLHMYIFLYDLPISENSELLLQGRLLLSSDIQFVQCRMDVLHHLEEVVRKTDVDIGTVDELIQSFFIHLLVVVTQEYYLIMQILCVMEIGLLSDIIELL
jgi:hypothetical protein